MLIILLYIFIHFQGASSQLEACQALDWKLAIGHSGSCTSTGISSPCKIKVISLIRKFEQFLFKSKNPKTQNIQLKFSFYSLIVYRTVRQSQLGSQLFTITINHFCTSLQPKFVSIRNKNDHNQKLFLFRVNYPVTGQCQFWYVEKCKQ